MRSTELESKWVFVLRRYVSVFLVTGILTYLVVSYFSTQSLAFLLNPLNIWMVVLGWWIYSAPRKVFQYKKDKHEPEIGWGSADDWVCAAERDLRKKVKEVGYQWWRKKYVLSASGSRYITNLEKAITMKRAGQAQEWLKEKSWAEDCYEFLLRDDLDKYSPIWYRSVQSDLDLKFLLQMDIAFLEGVVANEILELGRKMDYHEKNRAQLQKWLEESDIDALKDGVGHKALRYTSKLWIPRAGALLFNRRKKKLTVNFYHFISFCQLMSIDISKLKRKGEALRFSVMRYFDVERGENQDL